MTLDQVVSRIKRHCIDMHPTSVDGYVGAVRELLHTINNETPGCLSDCDVLVRKPDFTEYLLREIHEELSDEIELEIHMNFYSNACRVLLRIVTD